MVENFSHVWQMFLFISVDLQWYQLNNNTLEIQVIFIHSTHFLGNSSNQFYIKSAISTENGYDFGWYDTIKIISLLSENH